MLLVEGLTAHGIDIGRLFVADGECLAVVGPSGAGKSLLLRAIADLDPNEGRVTAGDLDRAAVSAPLWRRRVAYVPAQPGWWADTVGEHFENAEGATALLERLLLPAAALGWPVARLSNGEQQRIGFVRALLNDPVAMLLDEPTGSLDQAATAALEALLSERMAGGLSVVMVTHDDAQARRLAKRLLRLEGGRIVDERAIAA